MILKDDGVAFTGEKQTQTKNMVSATESRIFLVTYKKKIPYEIFMYQSCIP